MLLTAEIFDGLFVLRSGHCLETASIVVFFSSN